MNHIGPQNRLFGALKMRVQFYADLMTQREDTLLWDTIKIIIKLYLNSISFPFLFLYDRGVKRRSKWLRGVKLLQLSGA
jgi:hypothetical protein